MVASSQTDTAKKDPINVAERRSLISQAVAQVLGPLSVNADSARLEALTADQKTLDQAVILPRVKALLEELIADEKSRTTAFEQATIIVDQLVPKEALTQEVPDELLYKYGTPTVIEDPIAWKNGLRISTAARPVKPLVEFEETNVKL